MPWLVTCVPARFGGLFCARSDQSDFAEFGDELDHCPGEASGDGVGKPFGGLAVCGMNGDVVSVVL